ncbi:unnamed protein product [Schistosoma curassoni]|uniref:Uncharacterized protein n=1 Tax=Schistosoma curassoni TaxID=6186 RepID=A0A183JTK8_9TREM|nr:unnamed protein product [Schistosoma curassoni]
MECQDNMGDREDQSNSNENEEIQFRRCSESAKICGIPSNNSGKSCK